jgi:cytochrome c553
VKKRVAAVMLGLGGIALGTSFVHAGGNGAREPLWAYGFATPPAPAEKTVLQNPPARRGLRPNEDPVEQTRVRHIPGSSAAFSLMDIRDGQNVIDWFPGDHPPMPDVVKHGPSHWGNLKRGCASCHLANGKGRPENAQPAALPVAYFMRQIHDFKTGQRRSADPRKPNTNTMINLAMVMTDAEVRQAAAYFSAIKWTTPWVRVVETDTVPKTRINGNLFLAIEQARTEPIAGRIIEVPEDTEQAETYRNPHSGFVAYVPVGSLKKGKDLVETGGATIVGNKTVAGKTMACAMCHGRDLMGDAEIPPIAGRSPSYMARQLYDIQRGTRNGTSTQLMKPVVADLTEEDIVAITAYVASVTPRGVSRPPAPQPLIPRPVTNTAQN